MKIKFFAPDIISVVNNIAAFAHPEHTAIHNHTRTGLTILGHNSQGVSLTFEQEPTLQFNISHVKLVELLLGHNRALSDIEVKWIYDCTANQLKLINLATFTHEIDTVASIHQKEDVRIMLHPSQFKVGNEYHPVGKPKVSYWCTACSSSHVVLIPKNHSKEPYIQIENTQLDKLLIMQMIEKGPVHNYDKSLMTKLNSYSYHSALNSLPQPRGPRATLATERDYSEYGTNMPLIELVSGHILTPWFIPEPDEQCVSASKTSIVYLSRSIKVWGAEGTAVKVANMSLTFVYNFETNSADIRIEIDPTTQLEVKILDECFKSTSIKDAFMETVQKALSSIREALNLSTELVPDSEFYISMQMSEIPCHLITFKESYDFKKQVNAQGVEVFLIPSL